MDNKHLFGIMLLLALCVLASPALAAMQGTMTLLAVSQNQTGFEGTTATLYLEVRPGTGKVFISTYPLTKVDTQISFRLAKEFACDYLDKDCDEYDFFYEVSSNTPIVGGPSAGGAATALTTLVLAGLPIDPRMAITGTINSGGIIGPVAGVKEKIEAAHHVGITSVLIPEGNRYYDVINISGNQSFANARANTTHSTIDLVEYGKSLGMTIREVADIEEAMAALSGRQPPKTPKDLIIDPEYLATMRGISEQLCGRSHDLAIRVRPLPLSQNANFTKILAEAENLTASAANAVDNESYYSASSFCFGANVKYNYVLLKMENASDQKLLDRLNATAEKVNAFDHQFDNFQYKTITDLQTYLVVKERLTEANDYVKEGRLRLIDNSRDDAMYAIAFSEERLESAYDWAAFIGKGGKQFILNKETLHTACVNKISEAEERLQYAKTFVPLPFSEISEELSAAEQFEQKGSFELCIFRASDVKARTNLIITAIGVEQKDIPRLLDKKLEIARRTIIHETEHDIFPIQGYSYYEYAQSLKGTDQYSTLLYAELALELSSFDLYFKQDKPAQIRVGDIGGLAIYSGLLIVSFVAGYVFAVQVRRLRRPGTPNWHNPKIGKQPPKGVTSHNTNR